jgi:hypothetical protein
MTKPNKATCKILPFVVPERSPEGQLEKWFRGVVRSNHDLMTALERLRDSYKLLMPQPPSETDKAVLAAVETTLHNARNARLL